MCAHASPQEQAEGDALALAGAGAGHAAGGQEGALEEGAEFGGAEPVSADLSFPSTAHSAFLCVHTCVPCTQVLWANVWTMANWLGHFPGLAGRASRFRTFVRGVFNAHPTDPRTIKAAYADNLAEWEEASPYAWYRLVVLGVVSVCLQDGQFWPELNVILARIRADPDFDKVVAGAAADSLVSKTPGGVGGTTRGGNVLH